MGKGRSPLGMVLLLAPIILATGCNRHDTESLSRIGRKIVDRASAAGSGVREKLDVLKVARGGLGSLQERVAVRLRWEKMLADMALEVVVSGTEIELKGTVKTAEQRARAVELAEATVGVERVLVSLTVAADSPFPSPDQAKKEE